MNTHIEQLMSWGLEEGLEINLASNEVDDGTYGHIIFATKTICIRANSDDIVILTLAHELGHWMGMKRSAMRYGHYTFKNSAILKEIDAYRYGWHLIRKFDIPITKNVWRQSHEKELTNYIRNYGKTPIVASPLEITPVEDIEWITNILIFLIIVGMWLFWS